MARRQSGCKETTYENRYRHKLNMLWPGQVMLSISGALLLLGMLLWLLKWNVCASAAFALAGAVLAVLLILVAIELHQDHVLNEIAMREHANEEEYGKY